MMGDGQSRETTSQDMVQRVSDSLLDRIDVALYALDANGLCVRWNRAAEALLGFSQADALGQDVHQLVHHHWPDGTPYRSQDCRVLQARASRSTVNGLEEVFWAKDGTPVLAECSVSPVTTWDGVGATVVTMKDLRASRSTEDRLQAVVEEQLETLRQRDAAQRVAADLATEESERQRQVHASVERIAADKIREQQALLGVVAEAVPVCLAVLDPQARYRWTNRTYAETMDPAFRDRDLSGTSYFDSIPAENYAELKAIFDGVLQTGVPFNAEAYPLHGVDRGTTYWRWTLLRLGNGDLMSTGADVTEQVTARREVEAVYANAPIALSLVDGQTLCYLRVNLRYAELFGVTPERMVGAKVGSFSDPKQSTELLAKAQAGQQVVNQALELRPVHAPEAKLHLLVNATPNVGETGAVETISIAITDVSSQKRAEDALVQADKLAAVGRLAASISHEINNPLEAVTNLLYLVGQDVALSAESAGYLRQAEEELQRVSHIASQTLRFQRHAVEAVQVTPRQLVDPVVALYRGRLKHTRIEVAVEYKWQPRKLTVFEGDIRQILNNLLGNAIDAMQGGGKITIRAQAARCARTRRTGTRISVADTGSGMSEETARHIFEPFFTTKGASGSGLGLWISHTLAERHAGSLRVRSRKASTHASGKGGTVFSLFLPDVEPDGGGGSTPDVRRAA